MRRRWRPRLDCGGFTACRPYAGIRAHAAGPVLLARDAGTLRSKARPAATPTRSRPPSHNRSIAKQYGAVSTPQPSAIVIGDGAEWIWNLAAEQFPGAIEIVDLYHAKQHLCDVAKAIYGPGTDLADRWASDRRVPDENRAA